MNQLQHSAKGTSWTKKDHKYIKKENGKYYYRPESYKTEEDKDSSSDQTSDKSKSSLRPELTDFYIKNQVPRGDMAGMVWIGTDKESGAQMYMYPNNYREKLKKQRYKEYPTKAGEALRNTSDNIMNGAKALGNAINKLSDVAMSKDYVTIKNDQGQLVNIPKKEIDEYIQLTKKNTGKDVEVIKHSAKGTTWTKEDHKYIKKENGKYFYSVKKTQT